MNVFEAVKQSVTTRQAAEHYGIHVGRNGMACCPFHHDKTPSMKLDRRYHCFGCGADGDVIDFAAALYGLGKKEAAVQLAQDFGLSYEDWKPPGKAKKPKPRQKSPEEQFQEAYTYEALKLFLLGAISRAFQPGCKFEIMLCLVGGQGAGKSTFFRLLAVRDEWFSDDLRKLDDDNVYRKLQGHWIIEMSEMMATANAKSIEEIKSFLSRQKEVYKIPYETHPADRPRQCVFGGTSNALDFLPLDRSGNRRFIPVMVYPEQAEVHILEDEAASRAYIGQMWAEAMEIYRSGRFKLAFSPAMQRYLKEHQRDFMPEDTKAGMIQAYLDKYTGSMVCSKQLYKEALNHAFDEPKQWEIREINEIMNQCISGWRYFQNPRMFSEYGRQKGWERENPATDLCNPSEKTMDGFVEITEQMELPF
ncbi:VapE domain-containing protein [Blautia wexlerae]|uniref:VapE domain-containing protein n=1 Tax=Blautia wexlerae TaxID=418240 RepID=UPI003F6898E6